MVLANCRNETKDERPLIAWWYFSLIIFKFDIPAECCRNLLSSNSFCDERWSVIFMLKRKILAIQRGFLSSLEVWLKKKLAEWNKKFFCFMILIFNLVSLFNSMIFNNWIFSSFWFYDIKVITDVDLNRILFPHFFFVNCTKDFLIFS